MVGLSNGLFSGLVFVTVALTAFAVGVSTSFPMVRSAVRHRWFAPAMAVNVIVVPLLGYLITAVLNLDAPTTTAVVLCAVCAGGPLALKASQISKSDLTWSLSLVMVCLILNVVTVPLWSGVLLDTSVTLRSGDLLGVLGLAILVPIACGVLCRIRAATAEQWAERAAATSNVTLVLAVVLGVVAAGEELISALSSGGLIAVSAVVALAALSATMVRTSRPRSRSTILVTLNRATSVALLVSARAFPEEPLVLTAAVMFGVVQTVVAIGLALVWRGQASPSRSRLVTR